MPTPRTLAPTFRPLGTRRHCHGGSSGNLASRRRRSLRAGVNTRFTNCDDAFRAEGDRAPRPRLSPRGRRRPARRRPRSAAARRRFQRRKRETCGRFNPLFAAQSQESQRCFTPRTVRKMPQLRDAEHRVSQQGKTNGICDFDLDDKVGDGIILESWSCDDRIWWRTPRNRRRPVLYPRPLLGVPSRSNPETEF